MIVTDSLTDKELMDLISEHIHKRNAAIKERDEQGDILAEMLREKNFNRPGQCEKYLSLCRKVKDLCNAVDWYGQVLYLRRESGRKAQKEEVC